MHSSWNKIFYISFGMCTIFGHGFRVLQKGTWVAAKSGGGRVNFLKYDSICGPKFVDKVDDATLWKTLAIFDPLQNWAIFVAIKEDREYKTKGKFWESSRKKQKKTSLWEKNINRFI